MTTQARAADDRPVVLVTGANKGIGWHTAAALVARGCVVYLGARDPGRGTAAAARIRSGNDETSVGTVDPVRLDVTDPALVDEAAATIEKRSGRLDVLINNAGVLVDSDVVARDVTAEHLRRTFETNVFGVVTVTGTMLPLLLEARAGRVLNLSSSLGSLGVNSAEPARLRAYQRMAYGPSKAALNAVTLTYANALVDTAITFDAVEPGFVATDLNGHAGPGDPADAARLLTSLALDDRPPHSGHATTARFVAAQGPVPW